MQQLTGGREGIYKQNSNVIRPLNQWSSTIHQLLQHLTNKGFTQSPRFIKTTKNNEILTFVEGETYNYPLIGAIASEQALTSGAKLLRKLHDCSADFLAHNDSSLLQWMLVAKEPQEVICHGDFTPYNVALNGNEVVGVFDFDTAHPAPRVWDIAFSIYCWAPFKTDPDDALGSLTSQIQRAKIFCDSYGATQIMRKNLVETMISRLQTLVNYMRQQAGEGNKQFSDNLADGHHLGYLADIEYLQKNREAITVAILKKEEN